MSDGNAAWHALADDDEPGDYRALRRLAGLCTWCTRHAAPGRSLCEAHLRANVVNVRRVRERKRWRESHG